MKRIFRFIAFSIPFLLVCFIRLVGQVFAGLLLYHENIKVCFGKAAEVNCKKIQWGRLIVHFSNSPEDWTDTSCQIEDGYSFSVNRMALFLVAGPFLSMLITILCFWCSLFSSRLGLQFSASYVLVFFVADFLNQISLRKNYDGTMSTIGLAYDMLRRKSYYQRLHEMVA